MPETESLCAENIVLKDITRSRRGELISFWVDNKFFLESDDDDLNVSDFSGSNQDTSSTLTASRNITSKDDSSRTSDSPASDMSQHREDSG